MRDDLQQLRRLPLKLASVYSRERRIPLHAMISSGGHACETDPGYRWNGMDRGSVGFAVLQLTLSGRGRLDTGIASHDLTKGDLMVVKIPSEHSYYLPKDSPRWEFAYLVMYGSEALRIISSIQRRKGSVMAVSGKSRIPGAFCAILRDLFLKDPPDVFRISALAYELCTSLLSETYEIKDRAEASRFEALKLRLQKDVHQNMNVSEMADMVGLSRTHFSRLFKKNEGVSPREYVEDLRLKKALSLLYSEETSVKEIAYSCGIHDVNYFCRLFRKHTGMSPGEYRRSCL